MVVALPGKPSLLQRKFPLAFGCSGLSIHTRQGKSFAAALTAAASLTAPEALADNPLVQTLYTADPAPMVHEGTLYVYTTHDEDVTVDNFFTMNDWRVYSSTDVVNWTDHGSPLHYNDFSWAGGNAWAGQVTFRNGMFYFYVPVVRTNGGNAIGVAVSESPLGPFEDALGSPLVSSDCGDIDPTVFIDDDGQAYLYWGNPNLCYVRLNEDMVSYQGDVVHVPMTTQSFGVRTEPDRPTSYEEGPWLYKREERYYLVYPGGPLPEHIAYSTSSSPTGPWTYGGVIMPAEGSSFTNHPGVVDYKGKSLFFYHNGALPGGGGFKRSVCVEEFTYGADGSFPQLRMTTEGAAAVDTLNPFVRVEAETIAWQEGIETEICSEGGMNVASIENGDHIKVENVDFRSGAVSFEARVASANAGGNIELRLDEEMGTLVGNCDVSPTGDWQTWTTTRCEISSAAGVHDLYLRFTGGGGALFNFDWWRFDALDPIPDAGAPPGPGDAGGNTSGGLGGEAGSAEGGAAGEVGAAGTGGTGGSSPTGAQTGDGGSTATPPVPSSTNGSDAPLARGGISNSASPSTTTTPSIGTNFASPGTSGAHVPPVSIPSASGAMSGSGGSSAVSSDPETGGCTCRTGGKRRERKLPPVLLVSLFLVAARWRRPDATNHHLE